MTAIAAVDTALWDIKGKAAGMPVYQLIGGRSRNAVTVYGHANGATIPATLDQVASLLDQRLPRRTRPGRHARPGQGVRRRRRATSRTSPRRPGPARKRRPGRPRSTSTSSRSCSRPYASGSGRASTCCTTSHHRLTPIEAARLGKALEPYSLFWLEDPISEESQEGFRLIRQHTTTPIAIGEVYNSIWDCRPLITEQLIDYIRTTSCTPAASPICAGSSTWPISTTYGPGRTGATDLSPVCLAAALHVDVAVPNFGIQEYMPHTGTTDRSSRTPTASRTG